VQFAQYGEFARLERLRPLESEPRRLLVPLRPPAHVLEQRKLLGRPRRAARRRELVGQQVPQREQVLGIGGCVAEHVVGERPAGPVGPLEALVEGDALILLEKRGEPDAGLVEQLGGDPGVEEVRGPDPNSRSSSRRS
jgi:hypothetical protein